MVRLNDSERMLLQHIMAAGAIDEVQVKKIAKKLTGEELTKDDVDDMVNKIAESVRPFALDMRRGVYDDGKMYVGICNTSNDALTQFGSHFKPWEIVLLRKAIEEIVESDEGALHESDLINLRENQSVTEVAELLRKLTNEKWLAMSMHDAGQLTLGPRAYLELIAFLRDLEIKKCSICQYEMLQGVPCKGRTGASSSNACGTLIHASCLERYEERGLKYKCATCKQVVRRRAVSSEQ